MTETKCNLGKTPPCVSSAPSPIKANAGEVARLAVQVSGAVEGAIVSWKREGEELCFEQDDRLRLGHSAGFYYLEISRCRPSDSGVYQCNIQCENGSCSSSIALRITGQYFYEIGDYGSFPFLFNFFFAFFLSYFPFF